MLTDQRGWVVDYMDIFNNMIDKSSNCYNGYKYIDKMIKTS